MNRLVVLGLGCLFVTFGAVEAQGPKKDDVPKFIKSLTAKDAKERLEAVEGIAKIGELKKVYAKEAYTPLANVVRKDDDGKVREAAAQALGRIDADASIATPALIEGLKDKERAVQIASANSLGALGKGAADAIPALKELADKAKEELAKAKEDQAKAKAGEDKEKEKLARARAQQAQQMLQAVGGALKSIAQ
ncbi:MAG: HEAT repeat domain-containing protein [Gemmataceae bacterium]|nr:HEAT repeat domain-containing protein [Gemmataceae bacterium]